jgi:chromosome segregation ATPase
MVGDSDNVWAVVTWLGGHVMSETVLLALVAIAVPLIAALTGLYSARLSQRSKTAEAQKTEAEAEEIFSRVRALQWQREAEMSERITALEFERRNLADRLQAIEDEVKVTRTRHEQDLRNERRRYEETAAHAKRVQESLEVELHTLREMVVKLTEENHTLHEQIKRLASRVETGELDSGSHKRGT